MFGAVQVRNELNCYMFLVKYKQYVKYDGWPGPKLCQSNGVR